MVVLSEQVHEYLQAASIRQHTFLIPCHGQKYRHVQLRPPVKQVGQYHQMHSNVLDWDYRNVMPPAKELSWADNKTSSRKIITTDHVDVCLFLSERQKGET